MMTQLQFDMICKIVSSGAPALADELINSLNNLVVNHNRLAEENKELKVRIETMDSDCESCDASKDENPN